MWLEFVELLVRDVMRLYLKFGIIDGGVGEVFLDWVIGKWDFMVDGDGDFWYGIFIGGLVVVGLGLNGFGCCLEVDGVELVDIVVFFDID